MKLVYVDNNATTRVAPEVYQAMVPYLTEDYFNPSSMYEPARGVAAAVSDSRRRIAEHFGPIDPREVVFTSCATESNNMAIRGCVWANPRRRHVITTAVEHPAVLEVCKELQRQGHDVTFLGVDCQGNLSVADFVRALRPDTLLVSVMHANNETGVVFPVAELARIAKETNREIIFHTDATQSVGKLPIDMGGEFRHVDLLSFSGHKLHAPKGVGALLVRRGTPLRPFMIGGHQEAGRRAGTENVPLIVGLAAALDLTAEHHKEDQRRIRAMRDRLEAELEARIPHVEINGRRSPRLANTTSIACQWIEGEGMLYQLSDDRICASSGSACTSGSLEPSHVLTAMNVPFTAVHGSVRFSFSRYNTEQDVDRIIEVFPRVVSNLRNLSPYWDTEHNAPRPDAEQRLRQTH